MRKRKYVLPVLCMTAMLLFGTLSTRVRAEEYPDVLLGVFFTSAMDTTDTIYMSEDGYNFYKLSAPFVDDTPDNPDTSLIHAQGKPEGVSTFHDPSIIYKDGYFWMISGYADGKVDEGTRRAIPMMSYSKDLVNWSYGNSGFPRLEDNLKPADNPPGEERWRAAGLDGWDFGSADFMVDDDGTVWVFFVLGFYADYHPGSDWVLGEDLMAPYLAKITDLKPGKDPALYPDEARPHVVYEGDAKPIKLPKHSENRIDGSLYKENGWYYLSIKENGIINELWRIRDLNRCDDESQWELVSPNMQGGSEGPSLTKYNGMYLLYTDKLNKWPNISPEEDVNNAQTVYKDVTSGIGAYRDTSNGNYVCVNYDILDPYGWGGAHKIKTWNTDGTLIENRHGTVITVTDPEAKKVIWDLYRAQYGSNPAKEAIPKDEGWVRKDYQEFFWYENGVRQGYEPDKSQGDKPYVPSGNYRGKEIYDPNMDAWFWLDNVNGGAMAYDKDVYQESYAGIFADREDGTGKWVRYDYYGRMKKGEQHDQDPKDGNWYWYYFDLETGAMAKGYADLPDGRRCYYDLGTGKMIVKEGELCETLLPDGTLLLVKENGDVWNGWYTPDGDDVPDMQKRWYWYENGIRQGYNANDPSYRGKEILDPNAGEKGTWFWLDNDAMGAKAVGKAVYQESYAGKYADREDGTGKWVRYDDWGSMIKGWYTEKAADGSTISYYFDPITGAMAKGEDVINGEHWFFDLVTGIGTRLD